MDPLPFWAVGVQMVALTFSAPIPSPCTGRPLPHERRLRLRAEAVPAAQARHRATAHRAIPQVRQCGGGLPGSRAGARPGGKHHHHDKKAEKKKKKLKKLVAPRRASITLPGRSTCRYPVKSCCRTSLCQLRATRPSMAAAARGGGVDADAASSGGYGLRGGGGSSYLEPLRPYVTVDVLGATRARRRVPQSAQCGQRLDVHLRLGRLGARPMASDGRGGDDGFRGLFVRSRSAAIESSAASATKEDVLAMAVVPWWSLREGVRSIPLTDRYGRKLVLARLVVSMHFRGDRLTDESARRRVHSDLRPPGPLGRLAYKGIDVTAAIRDKGEEEMDFEVPVVAFKHKTAIIAEEAGAVRLAVKRKSGDAPCLVNFSTSDGTAAAGYDYTRRPVSSSSCADRRPRRSRCSSSTTTRPRAPSRST